MDKGVYKIAVASSDGIVVNKHFGKAELFSIYEADDEGNIRLLETRSMKAVCESGNHDESRLRENLSQLSDCSYLLVSRIGNEASLIAESMGINAYEIPGIIQDSVNKLIQYIKIQKLFE